MTALATLQARFLDGLLGSDDAALADIRGASWFPAERRMAVYRNAYRRRLVEALASTFERTAALVGPEAFDIHGLGYVDAHPPVQRSLGRYGSDFPEWLRARADAASDPLLAVAASVAVIDGHLRRAFDAADAAPIERGDVLALPPGDLPGLRFEWHASLQVAVVAASGIEAWRQPAAFIADGTGIDAGSPVVPVAFWRRDGQTFFRTLPPGESELLQRLRAGACLAQGCIDEDAGPALAMEAAAVALLGWIDEGWVTALRSDPSP